jgi:hypothetical protein
MSQRIQLLSLKFITRAGNSQKNTTPSVPKSNLQMTETEATSTPLTHHIHLYICQSFFRLGTRTLIKTWQGETCLIGKTLHGTDGVVFFWLLPAVK